jgi:hypothetical protein
MRRALAIFVLLLSLGVWPLPAFASKPAARERDRDKLERSGLLAAFGKNSKTSANVVGPGGIGTGLNETLDLTDSVAQRNDPAEIFRLDASAEVAFKRLESRFSKYQAFEFRSEKTLGRDLAHGLKEKRDLSDRYLKVIAIGSPQWSVAAMVRIAQLPCLLAGKVKRAPLPKQTDPEPHEQHVSETHCGDGPSLDTAGLDLMQAAYKAALSWHVENEWSTLAKQRLDAGRCE